MSNFKIGDLDGNGNIIKKIYQQGLKQNGDFFIFYEDGNEQFKYGAKGFYSQRIVPLKNSISELSQLSKRIRVFSLIRKDSELRHNYNGIIASTISSFFDSQNTAEIETKTKNLKSNFLAEIQSLARFNYLVQTGKIFIGIVSIALLFWLYETRIVTWTNYFMSFHRGLLNFIFLAAAGAGGAFISISRKITTIQVDKYLPDVRTKLDALMRITIGCIFGNLLVWFSKAEFFNLINKDLLTFENLDTTLFSLTIAVIGGFGERLVPNILTSKASVE